LREDELNILNPDLAAKKDANAEARA